MSSIRHILGIDPGSGTIGYAYITVERRSIAIIDSGTITTTPHAPISEKLIEIEADLLTLMSKYPCSEVGVEKLFFAKNVTTALDVAHARGVILLCAKKQDMTLYEYSPPEIKKGIAGRGNATKGEVRKALWRLLKEDLPPSDDARDALAVALMVAYGAKKLSSRDR